MVLASAVLAVMTELPVSSTAWNARRSTSSSFTCTVLFIGTTQCLHHERMHPSAHLTGRAFALIFSKCQSSCAGASTRIVQSSLIMTKHNDSFCLPKLCSHWKASQPGPAGNRQVLKHTAVHKAMHDIMLRSKTGSHHHCTAEMWHCKIMGVDFWQIGGGIEANLLYARHSFYTNWTQIRAP